MSTFQEIPLSVVIILFLGTLALFISFPDREACESFELRERIEKEVLINMQKEISRRGVAYIQFKDFSGKENVLLFQSFPASMPKELGTFQVTNSF